MRKLGGWEFLAIAAIIVSVSTALCARLGDPSEGMIVRKYPFFPTFLSKQLLFALLGFFGSSVLMIVWATLLILKSDL
jgi:hypothetical protein